MAKHKKFVVQLPKDSSRRSVLLWFAALIPCGYLIARDDDKERFVATFLVGVCLVFLLGWRLNNYGRSSEAAAMERDAVSVTIYTMGVQICRDETAAPMFVPHEAILDVIILEMVHSYKVTSAVMFRILKPCRGTNQNVTKLLQEDKVALVPAFSGVEMSYADCQAMCHGISMALGKL